MPVSTHAQRRDAHELLRQHLALGDLAGDVCRDAFHAKGVTARGERGRLRRWRLAKADGAGDLGSRTLPLARVCGGGGARGCWQVVIIIDGITCHRSEDKDEVVVQATETRLILHLVLPDLLGERHMVGRKPLTKTHVYLQLTIG